MSRYTPYGPGDSITWPPCTGHPNDPRTDDLFPPDDDENEDDLEQDNEDDEPEHLRNYLDHCSSSERDEENPDFDYDHEPSDN